MTSTPKDKAKLAYKFLVERARLGRVTTHHELAAVVGKGLHAAGLRPEPWPVRREKLDEVLHLVDKRSLKKHGVLLSSLVVHFHDNKAGRAFFARAQALGMFDPENDSKGSFHNAAVFATLQAFDDRAQKQVAITDKGLVALLEAITIETA